MTTAEKENLSFDLPYEAVEYMNALMKTGLWGRSLTEVAANLIMSALRAELSAGRFR